MTSKSRPKSMKFEKSRRLINEKSRFGKTFSAKIKNVSLSSIGSAESPSINNEGENGVREWME